MKPNMLCSRTNIDVALLDPGYGVQKHAAQALARVFERLGTPDAIVCLSCCRVFTWSDGAARETDNLPAAYVHVEREKGPPASALLCWDCNNDEGIERALTEIFQADEIKKITPTHTGGHA